MRRRDLLGALGASLGALAGCAGRSAPAADSLTPAPVPTDEDRVEFATADATPAPVYRFPSSLGCPLLPSGADVYVCSPRAYSGGVQLFPERSRFVRTAVSFDYPLSFTLSNQSVIPFETRKGWWVLARNGSDGWTTLAAGQNRDRLEIRLDDAFVWRVGSGDRTVTGTETPSHDVSAAVDDGLHAFGVRGYHEDARLVALLAPFEVFTQA